MNHKNTLFLGLDSSTQGLKATIIDPKLKVLLKNFKLSDDIAFRFSDQSWEEYPLTADKFVGWLNQMGKEEEAALYQERAFSLFGLPGMDGDFVEMEKEEIDIDDDKNQTIAGS